MDKFNPGEMDPARYSFQLFDGGSRQNSLVGSFPFGSELVFCDPSSHVLSPACPQGPTFGLGGQRDPHGIWQDFIATLL